MKVKQFSHTAMKYLTLEPNLKINVFLIVVNENYIATRI